MNILKPIELHTLLFFNFLKKFIFEKEREHEQGRCKEKGNTEYEAGFRLRGVSTEPNMGLELMNCEITT